MTGKKVVPNPDNVTVAKAPPVDPTVAAPVVAAPEPESEPVSPDPVEAAPAVEPTPDGDADPTSGSEPVAEPTVAEPAPVEIPSVPTALNPDTWPDPNAGTVTDPVALAAAGMPVSTPAESVAMPAPSATAPSSPVVSAAPPEQPSADHTLFQCEKKGGAPTPCPQFWAVVGTERIVCPSCGGTHIRRV